MIDFRNKEEYECIQESEFLDSIEYFYHSVFGKTFFWCLYRSKNHCNAYPIVFFDGGFLGIVKSMNIDFSYFSPYTLLPTISKPVFSSVDIYRNNVLLYSLNQGFLEYKGTIGKIT